MSGKTPMTQKPKCGYNKLRQHSKPISQQAIKYRCATTILSSFANDPGGGWMDLGVSVFHGGGIGNALNKAGFPVWQYNR